MAEHIPVLLPEVLTHLQLAPNDIVIDATLGGGGHTRALLEATAPNGTVIGIEADPRTLDLTARSLVDAGPRFRPIHGNFRHIGTIVPPRFHGQVAGILYDLGLSSIGLNDPERGFSLQHDGPLDMRFDPESQTLTAATIINEWSPEHLEELFIRYGQERAASTIVRHLVDERSRQFFTRTLPLALAIAAVVPRRGRIHPATKVFQALRMAVNDELGAIAMSLPAAVELLRPNGRLAVITFHSVEDRAVKQWAKAEAASGRIEWVNAHVIVPKRTEILTNPRARSAKLRVLEKK